MTKNKQKLTNTTDSEAWGAVSPLLSALRSALGGGVASAHGPVHRSASVIVKLHDLKHAEHWNRARVLGQVKWSVIWLTFSGSVRLLESHRLFINSSGGGCRHH